MKKTKESLAKAVALKYEADKNSAPVVLAKGTGLVADRIIFEASDHGVAVHEDSSLVEVLLQLEVQEEIPSELYAVMAEILSFVYQADRRLGEKGGSRDE